MQRRLTDEQSREIGLPKIPGFYTVEYSGEKDERAVLKDSSNKVVATVINQAKMFAL